MRDLRLMLPLLILGVLALSACSSAAPTPAAAEQVLVAASIHPLADMTQQVGGSRVRVLTLVPPGASAHVYELTPAQVQQVARARVLVLNGVGLEFWAPKLIAAVGNPNLVVVDTSEGIEILQVDEHEPRGNPHIWLDPLNAITQVAHIRDALLRADPDGAEGYRAGAERFTAELRALDREIAGEVATWRQRQFIAFHAAYAYFARRYGLVQAAVIETTPGREPSPAEIAAIIATARRIGARAIFAEPQFSPKAAQVIAEEAGIQVLFLNPLESVAGGDTGYIALMRYNLAQMAKALR